VGAAAARRRKPLADGERIAINSASADEIDRLPRVGPALAKRIVAARDSLSGFRDAAALGQVKGVGPKMLANLEPHLDFTENRTGTRTRTRTRQSATATTAPRGVNRSAKPQSKSKSEPALAVDPLDINRASAAELESLPGVGPALASRIVAYRDSVGPFRSLSDLDRVPGIGPALLRRIEPLLRFPT
jgi:competence ComEA-like helix-hairpin-helix protein